MWISQQAVEAEKVPNENNQPSPNAKTTTASKINARMIAVHVFKYGILYAIGGLIFISLVTDEARKPPLGTKSYKVTPVEYDPFNDIPDVIDKPSPYQATPARVNPKYADSFDLSKLKPIEDARQPVNINKNVNRSSKLVDPVFGDERQPVNINENVDWASFKLEYVRPSTAPNGRPWPTSSGYLKGEKHFHTDGLSTVTVDNTRNDSDVFVKLVTLDERQAYPVRQFFISAFGKFTLFKVRAGSYDIRYRDLTTGGLSRSEAFTLKEKPTYDGAEFSNITMTLYKVQNGNMQTYGLSEAEF